MKKLSLAFVLAVPLALAGTSSVPQGALDALTTIDSVPTQAQLDLAFMGSAANSRDKLIGIALDTASSEVGVRLGAIHALQNYCPLPPATTCAATDPAHQALYNLIGSVGAARAGSDVLVLRAAVEAIGPLEVQTDIDLLVPLLDHTSRDIRAATAHALRDLCNSNAVTPLRVRYQHEPTDQVKLAISEALRVLPCVQ